MSSSIASVTTPRVQRWYHRRWWKRCYGTFFILVGSLLYCAAYNYYAFVAIAAGCMTLMETRR